MACACTVTLTSSQEPGSLQPLGGLSMALKGNSNDWVRLYDEMTALVLHACHPGQHAGTTQLLDAGRSAAVLLC
jgi:hypothetical protein